MQTLLILKPNGQDVHKFKIQYLSSHLYFVKSGLKAICCSHNIMLLAHLEIKAIVGDCLKSRCSTI